MLRSKGLLARHFERMTAPNRESAPGPGSNGDARNTEDHTPPPLLLRPREAAAMLAISDRQLRDLEKRGAVPSRRIGRSVRFARDELEAWIALGCPTSPGAGDRVRREAKRAGGAQ